MVCLYTWVTLEETVWPLLMLLVMRRTLLHFLSTFYHLYVLKHNFDVDIVYMCPIIAQNGYQLFTESFNFDQPVLIDRIFIAIPASTLGESLPPQIYYGEFQEDIPVTINLSYSFGCSPNYTLCTVNTVLQCVPEADCVDGNLYSILDSLFPRNVCLCCINFVSLWEEIGIFAWDKLSFCSLAKSTYVNWPFSETACTVHTTI